MRTLYSYDTLGNLLRVEQRGGTTDSTQWRVRTFTYNSLSQLLTATYMVSIRPGDGSTAYRTGDLAALPRCEWKHCLPHW
jgi:YD repeat-containing protein